MDVDIKTLVASYQPSSETLRAMHKVSLLATVGPSASGKTTIMKALAEEDARFKLVVGETSRPLRPGEKEGVDFYTHTVQEIINELKAGRLTQVVVGPSGDYLHCTHVNNFPTEEIGLFPLIPQGVRQFRSLNLKMFTAAFIVPVDFEKWTSWLGNHAKTSNWTYQQYKGRLSEAKTSYEFALNDKEIHFVLNDDIDKAAERLKQVGFGKEPDDEETARKIAQKNFAKLRAI